MVATRRGLPDAYSDPEDEEGVPRPQVEDAIQGVEAEAGLQNKRVRNALRKLQIDGTAALAGTRVNRRETTGTYHYRGAVYDITADTPQTWIDQQPMRYRGSESETRSTSRSKPAVKRTLAEMQDSPDKEDVEDEARPAKRTRRGVSGPYARTRRQSQHLEPSSYHTRGAAAYEKAAAERQRQLEERKRRNRRFGTHQRSELVATIAEARDLAREKGYKVDPLTDSDMRDENVQWCRMLTSTLIRLGRVNSKIARLSTDYRCMKERGEFDGLLASTHSSPTPGGVDKEDEEAGVEDEKLEMPKSADIALQAYASPASASQQLQEDEEHSGPAPSSTRPVDFANKPFMRVDSPSAKSTESRPPSSTSKAADVALSIEHEPDIDTKEDADASVGNEGGSNEAVDQQINDELAQSVDPTSRSKSPVKPHSEPPAVDPKPKPAKVTSEPQSRHRTPKLSDRLDDDERAENAIRQDRRQSETAKAWRRRVQRELALLNSWPVSDAVPKDGVVEGGGEAVVAAGGSA